VIVSASALIIRSFCKSSVQVLLLAHGDLTGSSRRELLHFQNGCCCHGLETIVSRPEWSTSTFLVAVVLMEIVVVGVVGVVRERGRLTSDNTVANVSLIATQSPSTLVHRLTFSILIATNIHIHMYALSPTPTHLCFCQSPLAICWAFHLNIQYYIFCAASYVTGGMVLSAPCRMAPFFCATATKPLKRAGHKMNMTGILIEEVPSANLFDQVCTGCYNKRNQQITTLQHNSTAEVPTPPHSVDCRVHTCKLTLTNKYLFNHSGKLLKQGFRTC